MNHATITSIGVRYGAERRTNDWYRTHRAAQLAAREARGLARAFSLEGRDARSEGFDAAMAQHVDDPFRGARVRYLLGPDETVIGLELAAARDALEAAGLGADDVDLVLCASWLPEKFVAPGDAVHIAATLGTRAPAYNVETACSSGLACLELAEGLLAVGRYRRILVVLSSTNSRQASDDNTLGWISSDVAAAAIVERPVEPDAGILAGYVENSAGTAGVFEHRLVPTDDGRATVRMAVGERGGKALRTESGPDVVRAICHGALERADVSLDAIDFLGMSTPLAWSSALYASALGIDRERVTDLFPRLANVGLPFPLVHLHHGLAEGRARAGDRALLFTIGSTSSVGAMVLRLGSVALGPHPDPAQIPTGGR